MQDINWNDFKYVLAVHRSRSIVEAGRHLGVDETTVSRHLKRIDSKLPTRLFVRLDSGRWQATELGRRVIRHAEKVEREMAQLDESISRASIGLFGTVRITSVPGVVNKVLIPALKSFLSDNPNLNIELIPESRDLSLTQREADLAIRLARPKEGGYRVKARRIGVLQYAVYVASGTRKSSLDSLNWITYEDSYSHLPQAKWLNKVGKNTELRISGLRVADSETALEAVAAGLGKAALPVCIARNDPRIKRIRVDYKPPIPQREVWLLSLGEQQGNQLIEKVCDWLCTIDWQSR